MSIKVKTHPVNYPVELKDTKYHLRVVGDDDDTYIDALIGAATEFVTSYLHRSLITRTLVYCFDQFPFLFYNGRLQSFPIKLPYSPVQQIESMSYVNDAGKEILYTDYKAQLFADPAQLIPDEVINKEWPKVSRQVKENITITYKSGYGDTHDTIPKQVKQAIKMIVNQLYDNRTGTAAGITITDAPTSAKDLLNTLRIP